MIFIISQMQCDPTFDLLKILLRGQWPAVNVGLSQRQEFGANANSSITDLDQSADDRRRLSNLK